MSDVQAPPSSLRFLGLAEIYDRFRPSYPAAAIAAVLAGLPTSPAIVDVGSGTGISTRALLAAGARAIAIEPNDEMREVAVARGVDARAGTAAATGLPERSSDAVTCFQAFHWFASPGSLAEFRRILRPAGRLALVWNERDIRDAFTAEYAALERRFGNPDAAAAIDSPNDIGEIRLDEHGFGNVRTLHFANVVNMDADAVVGRMRSTSYAPTSPDVVERMSDALRDAHARHATRDGLVSFHYRTDVTLAELTPA